MDVEYRFANSNAVATLFGTDGACMTFTACQSPSLTYMLLAARSTAFAAERMDRGALLA